ncbi:NRDE family protein [Neptunomonas sp.]|uniref:NRDE family protein n=1 Tax=Neptunomonas sp. TaxID=1971898 RepID=UPI0025CCC7E1|nr:NRDE family protein [Neptunomonas sp.]
MCTVSWLINQNGYHLFFNRDEQRSRSKALPPSHYETNNVTALMPLDPDGDGSWISVNEWGFSLCLLNFYQGDIPRGPLSSRGHLLKSLSYLNTISAFTTEIECLNLNCYAPFTILAFERSFDGADIKRYQWDGKKLLTLNVSSPLTSSSVEFEKVSATRINRYTSSTSMNTAQQHIEYHQGHHPTKGHQSVCMHRRDAKTVSFSHILVTNEYASFDYQNGSPCLLMSHTEQENAHNIKVALRSTH